MNRNICVANLFGILACVLLAFREQLSLFAITAFPITIIANLLIVISVLYTGRIRLYLSLVVSGLLIFWNKDTIYMIDLFLLSFILRHDKLKSVIIINACFIIIFVIIWQLALSFGVLNSYKMVYNKGVAYTFGFANTNGFGLLFFQIACSVFLVLKNRFYLFQIILYSLLAYLCFNYSASRTSTMAIISLIFLLPFCRIDFLIRHIRWIIAILPIILLIAVLHVTIYKAEYGDINALLSGRLSYYEVFFMNMSISDFILGIPLPKGVAIDGCLIYMLLLFGILGVLIFCFLFYRSFVYKFDRIYYYVPFLISMFLYGVTESIYVKPYFISFVFWYLILNTKDNKSKLII